MADSLLSSLLPASFNGIPFRLETDSTQAGKLTTQHLYPFKNYSYTEELGQKLRNINIKGLVGVEDGNIYDYQLNRDALILALNLQGTGILIHPFYGMIVVVCTGYTVSNDVREVGISYFDINFEETLSAIFPSSLGTTISTIVNLVTSISSSASSNFGTVYKNNYPVNVQSSAAKCQNLSSTMSKNIAITSGVNTDQLNSFAYQQKSFNKNLYYNIQTPALLGSAIVSLLNSYDNVTNDYNQAFSLNLETFGFGHSDRYVPYNTPTNAEAISNAHIINDTVNFTLLMNMYQNAALITYEDVAQVDIISQQLEQTYQTFIVNNNLNSVLLRRLESLRNATKQYLNGVSVNVSKLATITVETITPLSVLLHQYYNNFDYQNEILQLNNITDCTSLIGQMQVLTEV